MAEEQKSTPENEAKGVSENFVKALGLNELILGGVGIYGMWCLYGANVSRLFPSTGITFVDIGLLACAAAWIGKIIDLMANIFLAIGRAAIKKANISGYAGRIADELKVLKILEENRNPIDRGIHYVVLKDSKKKTEFEDIRRNAIHAYGATIVLIPYLLYVYGHNAPTATSLLPLIIAALFVFPILGFLHQLDLYKTVDDALQVLKNVKIESTNGQ
jgi:hypothetical protein